MMKRLLFAAFTAASLGLNAQDYFPTGNSTNNTWYYNDVNCTNCGSFYNPIQSISGNVINDAGMILGDESYMGDAYDGAFEIAINNIDSVYYEQVLDTVGTTIRFSEQLIDGLYISKSHYFSTTEPVVRTVFKVRNPSSQTKTASAKLYTNFGSDEATIIDTAMNGTINLSNADRWFTSWDFGQYDPILTWSRFGPGTIESNPLFFEVPGGSTDPLNYIGGNDYYGDSVFLTIPANSYKTIIQFNRMDSTNIAARLNVHVFDSADSVYARGYLTGLTDEQLLSVVNWDFSGLVCSPDLTTNVSGITISANLSGAQYQWIDCDNSNTAIAGETSQSFTPSLNGNYAVVITTSATCSDTSACVAITTVGLVDNSMFNSVSVNPNPSNGQFNVTSELPSTVEITDLAGHVIKFSDSYSKMHSFDLNEEVAGVYFVKVTIGDQFKTYKLVKN